MQFQSLLFVFFVFKFHIDSIENRPSVYDVITSDSEQDEILIMISFDGFRWDYLENHTLPNFKEYFLDQGVKVSNGLLNAFTTVTFPNHWTLATGLYPESHGIVANVMYDSKLNETFVDFGSNDNATRWFGQNEDAVPIWILNELNGKQSGIVGRYPGANVPIKNKTVSSSVDYADQLDWNKRVDILIDWILTKKKFNLGVLYFSQPDEVGHEFGPYSKELEAVLHKCDSVIGYLISKLKETNLFERTNIIVTSDHGMDTASLDKSIDLIDYVDIKKFKSYGGLTQINIFPVNDTDENEIYEALKKIPNYNVYKKSEVLSRLNYKNNIRIGKIVMYGNVGYEIFKANRTKFDWSSWRGDHGGDNKVSSMRPLFVARGPAFKQNYATNPNLTIESVDVYSLMCFILNLNSSNTNGTLKRIKYLLKKDYYDSKLNRLDGLKTFFYFKNFILTSFKFDSLVTDYNLLNRLNQTGHMYIIFLMVLLLCFVLVVHFWSSSRQNETIVFNNTHDY